jgi:hypothetical protein
MHIIGDGLQHKGDAAAAADEQSILYSRFVVKASPNNNEALSQLIQISHARYHKICVVHVALARWKLLVKPPRFSLHILVLTYIKGYEGHSVGIWGSNIVIGVIRLNMLLDIPHCAFSILPTQATTVTEGSGHCQLVK